MSKQHTPAPWEALPEEVDRPYIRIRGTQPGGRYKVANVLTPIYDGSPSREADETRANARLIAAAPELLEALQNIFTNGVDFEAVAMHCDEDGLYNAASKVRKAAELARAAIAKATGV